MAKGDIVLITFPFTDLSGSKLRPSVVLTETSFDYIMHVAVRNYKEPCK